MKKVIRLTPAKADKPRGIKVTERHISSMKYNPASKSKVQATNLYRPYEPPQGVLPAKKTGQSIAMDSGFDALSTFQNGQVNSAIDDGYFFPGFQILSQWSQISEYRKPCEVYAREMTRKWLKFITVGEKDKADKITKIEDEFTRLNVQGIIRKAIEHDALYGRSHIFFDFGEDFGDELKTPLVETSDKIAKGSLKRLTIGEAIWFYPTKYNANNPLDPTFYRPVSWYCMGQEIHSSRLCTIITRELPDIIKPAYAFAGLSLQQIMKPYIDNWLRTRQNISDLINAFTVWTLSTNMSQITMDGGADDLYNRLQLFNLGRDNHGVNAIDKDTESFDNTSVNLGGLDQLQAQAQEHMSAPSGLPLVYLTGITPAGLNASSQDEIEIFQDTLGANQEMLNPHIQRILNIVMLSLFGEIDKDICFEWNKLKIVSEREVAEIEKMHAEIDIAYCDAGVIAPDEVRDELINQVNHRYVSLDNDRKIEPPDDHDPDPARKDFHESIGGGN